MAPRTVTCPHATTSLLPNLTRSSSTSNDQTLAMAAEDDYTAAPEGAITIPPVKVQKLPYLTHHLPNLKTFPNPLDRNQYYHPSDGFYISPSDVILRQITYDLSGTFPTPLPHLAYHRAGPRKKIFFNPSITSVAIVTCGGLCPGPNTVIRELVVGLWELYGIRQIYAIIAGCRGFYSFEPMALNPKLVKDWHKRGGSVLETSRAQELKHCIDYERKCKWRVG